MDLVDEHRANCKQCGKCLEVCPRYKDPGLLERLYGYLQSTSEIEPDTLYRCLTCGLCAEACPEGLGIKQLISPARQKWTREKGLSDRQTLADPDAPNNIFKKIAERLEAPKYRCGPGSVVYFPGCAGTYVNTNMAEATVALLEKAGIDYTVLSGLEYCCGAVSAGAGNPGPLVRHGQKNIEEARRRGAKILVTACPGCFKAFKDIYPKMFGELGFEVLQVSQYLELLIEKGKLAPKTALKHNVFYHDPCHLTRGMGVSREARAVLESIPGTHLANKTPKNSACCGFGGGVRVNYPMESLDLALGRYRAAEDLGCDVIITNCGGCMQNLVEAGKGEKIEIVDLAEYLARALGINVERNDKKMLDRVNRAYRLCVSGYREPGLEKKPEIHASAFAGFSVKEKVPVQAATLSELQKAFLGAFADSIEAAGELSGEEYHMLIYSTTEAGSALNRKLLEKLGAPDLKVDPKALFKAIYTAVLGRSSGPRAGFFLSSFEKGFLVKRFREASAYIPEKRS